MMMISVSRRESERGQGREGMEREFSGGSEYLDRAASLQP